MFDEFIIKIPIQCTNCYHGAFKRFQTKELDCLLDKYVEGEPANQYASRPLNDIEKIEQSIIKQIYYPECSIFEKFPGSAEDRSVIINTLRDGEYSVYEYCHNCNSFFYVSAVVKNGIFIGIKEQNK